MILKVKTREELAEGLPRAARAVLDGKIVAFPTESFYGLGVNAADEAAVRRLFEVKERRKDRPILLLIPDLDCLGSYAARIPEDARRLINRFWPGGLTLVLEAGPRVSPVLTAGTGKIGLRLSSHPVAAGLARSAGVPITGTSANLSGHAPCVDAGEVFRVLGARVDLILDGGRSGGGKGSTILDVTVSPPKLLREGMIGYEEIIDLLA